MGWTMRRLAGSLGLTALLLAISLAASPSWAENLTYTYDDLGRLESLTYEDGTQILYTYDAGANFGTSTGVGAFLGSSRSSSSAK